MVKVRIRVKVSIRFSVWLVSGYAHVFILLSVVIVTFTDKTAPVPWTVRLVIQHILTLSKDVFTWGSRFTLLFVLFTVLRFAVYQCNTCSECDRHSTNFYR